MLKNAIIYKASLPAASDLRVHLLDRPTREIEKHEKSLARFEAQEDGFAVHQFPGGYALKLRVDEKILPSAILNAEVDKAVKKAEEESGDFLDRESQAEMRHLVTLELLEKALVKTRYVWGFYHQAGEFLFVDSATPGYADVFMNELVHVCGSVKTATIHISDISQGLTKRLGDVIEGDGDRIAPFSFGEYLKIKRKIDKGEPTEKITYAECSILCHEVADQIRFGFRVEVVELGRGGMSFRLSDKFHFKKIDWPPLDIDDEEDGEDPAAHRWKVEAAHKVDTMHMIAEDMCLLFEYTPPSLEEEEEVGAGNGEES